MAAVAEIVAPVTDALLRGGGGPALTLTRTQLEEVRRGLTRLREAKREEETRVGKLVRVVAEAPAPFLTIMTAEEQIEMLLLAERDTAAQLRGLEGIAAAGFDAAADEPLREMMELTRQMAEIYRDARWELMASRTGKRPPDEVLSPMSVGDLRKLLASD